MKLRIDIPVQVRQVMQKLADAGFSAYIVGGCVRDALRGESPHDWDMTTSAEPLQTKACFADYPVIETGLQHGTVTVVADHMPIEITTYRIDGDYSDNRRPDSVTFTKNLRDDLSRRDFTVNAMAYHPDEGLIDLFGGQTDLQEKRIACVGNAAARFDEDGLRILRALRFASVLDFSIAPETADAIHAQKDLLRGISAERIFAELSKLLCGSGAVRILREYADVLFVIMPELQPMHHFEQHNIHHCYDVYEHTLHVLENVPPTPMLRFAALLHDSGKPAAFFTDERGGHFHGHAEISTEIAKTVLTRLKSDRKTFDTVCRLVEHHDVVFQFDCFERQLKRWVNRIGFEETRMLILLHLGDVSAQSELDRAQRVAESHEMLAILDRLEQSDACLSLKKLALSGDDLLAMGIPQGKAIGAALQSLLEQVMDGSLPNERNALLDALHNQNVQGTGE